jgi:hypothetical protein
MSRAVGRMRVLAALSLLALAACGSAANNPIIQEGMGELGRLWTRSMGRAPAQPMPARVVTRADIERADVAAIQARLESDARPTLMYAASSNGSYVTYVSALRQQITLRGAQITGTRGLGWDLLSAWSETPDPLASPVPPYRWPAGVRRVYQFPGDGPQGRIEAYDCHFELPGAPAEMTIMQVRYRGVQIPEICVGATERFENLHFVDSSGAVWRSLQWTGPRMALLDLQVVEPYTGD